MDDWLFSRLSLAYDIARGFVEAQEDMRHHIPKLSPSPEASERVVAMIDKNCSQAFAFTHYIGEHFVTLVCSLQTRSAKRLLLNHERALIWKMQHDGVLEDTEALYLVEHIEHQMVGMREEKDES
jgi:hypothetical protein